MATLCLTAKAYPFGTHGGKIRRQPFSGPEQSKHRSLGRLIYALGIPQVGEHTGELLAGHYPDLAALTAASADQLQTIHEIGPKVAASVYDFFRHPETQAVIRKLIQAKLNLRRLPEEEITPGKFTGKTFVFTGELKDFTRSQAEAKVKALGAKASNSISKKTDYVVAGPGAGSKHEKAVKLGVKIVDEAGFKKLVNE